MPKCPKDCNKPNCVFFRKATIPAAMRNDEINPPQNGDFCNMLVVYEATGNVYLFPSDGVPVLLSATNYELLDNLPSINGVTLLGDLTLEDLGISQLVEEEAEERKTADSILQRQIDAITASSDVVDIVGTYEELEEYDTSRLHENDIIKVLADETIGGATAYYRWVNGQWEYIGEEGPYYTKNETDALLDQKMDISTLDDYYTKTETDTLLNSKADVSALAGKQDKLVAGANITIDQATNVISATVPSLTNYYTKQETYSQAEVDSLISGVEADIPTATSQLTNDSGFLTTLPIATDQILGGIKVGSGLSVTPDGTLSATGTSIAVDSALSTTSTNPVENRVITNALNNKANITDIPTVPTNVSAFYNDAGYVTSSTIAQNYYNKTETYTQTEVDNLISGVSADIPTKTSDLTNDGATGTSTYVELNQLAPVATSGSYNDLADKPTIMTGLVEMSYGEANAWAKFIAAYQAKQIVYCRASSAANPASGSQTRKAFMAYVNNATNPTSVEFQYVRSVSSKTASQPVDQVFVYTLTSANGGTWTVTTRDMGPKLAQGTNTTVSYSNGTYTISATQPTVPTKTSDLTNDGSDGTSTYVEADQLATVATSGSYNDLLDKPTIPAAQVNSDWNATSGVAQILNKPTLATVATSGLYSDLTGTPNIPIVNNATLTIQKEGASIGTFTANASTNSTVNIIETDPTVPAWAKASSKPSYSWTEITNKPTIPTKTSDLTNDSGFLTSTDYATASTGGVVKIGGGLEITNGVLSATGGGTADAVEWANVLNRPTNVSYWTNDAGYITSSDLPTVNNATLTIQKNGTNVQTFTANQSTNATANIVVPTKTSDLVNDGADGDSLYVTETDIAPAELGGEGNAIHIEGTTDCSAIDTQILGNIEQTTYAGKNLLDYTTVQQITSHGVTCSLSTDGVITLNGTCDTDNTRFEFSGVSLELDGTYTASYTHVSGTISNASDSTAIRLFKSDWTAPLLLPLSNNSNRVTQTKNGTYSQNSIRCDNGVVFSNYKIKIQLEQGSTATAWEPYVGGIPAPNPSYPQPIETVTGRQTVTVAGKNLLRNAYQATQTINGVTITSNADGTITANGTATGTINFFINGSNTQYNISAGTYTLSTGTNDSDTTYFMIVDKSFSGEWSSRYTSTRTITVPSGGGTIAPRIVIRPNTTLNNVVFKPMIERGSTATTFEPYKAQEYEINLGKNLINTNIALSDQYLNTNGGWATGTYTEYLNDEWANTPGASYTFTASERKTNSTYLRFGQYKADGTFISRTLVSALNQTITTTSECYKVVISLNNSESSRFVNPQLEKGSIASSYAAYFEPIELCKIDNYQDRIYKENGNWYLHKEIGKIKFASSTAWTKHSTTNGNVFMLSNTGFIGYPYVSGHIAPALMDTDEAIDLGTRPDSANGVFGINTGSQLRVFRGTYDASYTANTFKAEMVGHYIYGALATPTTTEITNDEILKGLAELDDAHGYEPITNITVSTPSTVPALLSVSTYAGGAIPAATNNRPGVVMIGDGLSVDECGKVSSGYYPIDIDVGYDSDFSNWDNTSKELLGPIISIAKDSLGEYRNQICGIAIPNATFTRRDNGQSLSVEEVYNLVDSDARVRLYNLPFIYATYSTGGGALSDWENLGKLGRIELSAKVEWERTDEWTEYGTRYGGDAPTTMACNLGVYIERREVVGNDPEYAIYLKFIRHYRP